MDRHVPPIADSIVARKSNTNIVDPCMSRSYLHTGHDRVKVTSDHR